MSEDRRRILGMLAEGKLTTEEADTLLDALGDSGAGKAAPTATAPTTEGGRPGMPRYLYVKVTGDDIVDVKVPLGLLRAGLKLTSLIPPQAMDQINDSMGEHGMSIDFNNLKPEDIDEIITSLREMEVNVQAKTGDNVRVWCE
jgi:hypothetical protein